MRTLFLKLLFLLSSISISADNKTTVTFASSAKFMASCAASLAAHNVLEFISTFAHEHGHGIAGGTNYNVQMIPQRNVLEPWNGVTTHAGTGNINPFSTILGPLTGIATTYLQIIAVKTLASYMRKKPLLSSFHEGLKFPITFFSNGVKAGKQYCSTSIHQQAHLSGKNHNFTSNSLNLILFLRMGRIVGESIYGLLPYNMPPTPNLSSTCIGDGEQLWKTLIGPHMPTFTGNLPVVTLAIITAPFVIGAAQAICQKQTNNPQSQKN